MEQPDASAGGWAKVYGIGWVWHLQGKQDRDRDSMDRGVRRVVMRYTDGSSLAIEPERAGGGLLSDAVEIVDLFDKGSASLEFGSVNEQGQSDWRKH